MSENLKQRCTSSHTVSYEAVEDSPSHYSPSPYCQCIMDGFENPDDDELIFSSINIPDRVECGDKKLQDSFGNKLNTCGDGVIPDLSNVGKVQILSGGTIRIDNNISDTYLQSMTNLYNSKLNDDSEILASYIRCKEESYKPIINQFRDNATVITSFVSENQDSIKSILSNDKIDSVIDKTDNILSAVPTSEIKIAIDQVKDLKNLFSSWGAIVGWIVITLVSIFALSFGFVYFIEKKRNP